MRPINTCLNKQLSDICKKSIELDNLSHQVRAFLPPNLATACHVGSFNNGCLVLATYDAGFASQLRYVLPELRDQLRKEGKIYQLSSIKLNVLTPSSQKSSPQKIVNSISPKAKANIIKESQECTYEPLKRVLLHLAED